MDRTKTKSTTLKLNKDILWDFNVLKRLISPLTNLTTIENGAFLVTDYSSLANQTKYTFSGGTFYVFVNNDEVSFNGQNPCFEGTINMLFYNNMGSNKQLASVMKAPRSIYTSLYAHFMTMATVYEMILSNVNNRNFLPLQKDKVKIMGKLHGRLRLELGSGSLSHI